MGKVKELELEQKERRQINKAASTYLCDQDEGDNYDAYLKLQEESSKGNGDNRAADYVTVWQPLENSISVNEMLQLIDCAVEDNSEMPEILKGIDWKLLKKQKKTLIEEIDSMEKRNAKYFEETINDFNGILTLIDSLQDAAVDVYGLDENLVFEFDEDEEEL